MSADNQFIQESSGLDAIGWELPVSAGNRLIPKCSGFDEWGLSVELSRALSGIERRELSGDNRLGQEKSELDSEGLSGTHGIGEYSGLDVKACSGPHWIGEYSGLGVKAWSGPHGIGEEIGVDALGGEESTSFDLGCGPVDSAKLDNKLFNLVDGIGVIGAFVWSAAVANQSSLDPESHRFCDVVDPSSATSTTLTCTSCPLRTTTGAVRAKLMIKRIRQIQAKAMY